MTELLNAIIDLITIYEIRSKDQNIKNPVAYSLYEVWEKYKNKG